MSQRFVMLSDITTKLNAPWINVVHIMCTGGLGSFNTDQTGSKWDVKDLTGRTREGCYPSGSKHKTEGKTFYGLLIRI